MINFAKVDKHLYRGGSPTPTDILLLHKNFGIKKVISLDEETGKKIDRSCKLLGIKHIMLPIDMGKKSTLLKFLKHNLFDLIVKGSPTFIHCRHGRDRTGFAAALYRCEIQGWDCKKAISDMYKHHFGIGVDPSIKKLYKEIIQKSCGCHKSGDDVNSAYDIVDNSRDAAIYDDYTADRSRNLSWSLFEDYRVKEFPFVQVDEQYPEEQYQDRLDYGIDDSDDIEVPITDIPQIGQGDTYMTGINGAGPSMVGGGFV